MRSQSQPAPTVAGRVAGLVPYKPGKPIEEVKRELGLGHVIKLASNENALGPSPLAVEAMRDALSQVHLYPDGAAHELRHAMAAHLDVPADCLIFGNGSDELIHYLGVTYLEPGDEVIQADPSFVRYEAAAILNEAACRMVPLRDDTHDLEAMADAITPRTRMIFVANPNNPTGTIVTADEVERFLDRVPDRCIVVFDEAYFEYVASEEYPRTFDYVRERRNVIVLRTFSKIYGLAGLRLGYGVARTEIVAQLEQVREPFNVSSIAQAAGVAALRDTHHVAQSREMNAEGKRAFEEAFRRMGLPFAPTEANFVWVEVGMDAQRVARQLLLRGVIVRAFDTPGTENHIRVTIGTHGQNARFLQASAEVLAHVHAEPTGSASA